MTTGERCSKLGRMSKHFFMNSVIQAIEAIPVVAPVKAVEPKLVTPTEPVVSASSMRKPDLITSVVARTGAKPRDVKPIVDAVLATLGEAIAEGQELNLPPLGKLKLQRAKETDKARITIAKLRQPKI